VERRRSISVMRTLGSNQTPPAATGPSLPHDTPAMHLTTQSHPSRHRPNLCPDNTFRVRKEAFCRRRGRKRHVAPDANIHSVDTCRAIVVNCIADFVAQVAKFQANNNRDLILFRGQREDWPLVPKIGRSGAVKGRNQSELGATERRMFDAFQQMSLPFLASEPRTPLEWLAIAQHHGLPTRLLDWSGNALAALWFAVRKAPVHKNGVAPPALVWILNPMDDDFLRQAGTQADPFSIRCVQLYSPRHVNRRIIAQSGYFSLHPLDEKTSRFNPMFPDSQLKGTLLHLQIPADAFCDIRDDLERHGVSDVTMFPDLEGICRFITWNNSLLSDESHPEYVSLNLTA